MSPHRLVASLVGSALLVAVPPATTASAQDDDCFAGPTEVATGWIDETLSQIERHPELSPPRAARVLALVSSAMDRAATASGDPGAVDGAAAAVLAGLFPEEEESFAAKARGRDGTSEDAVTNGAALGEQVMALADEDGADTAEWDGVVPRFSGAWEPTGDDGPLEPTAPEWRTWVLPSASAMRPGPPPRPGDAQFRADMREIHALSQERSAQQEAVAYHWEDPPGSVTPPGRWNVIAARLVRDGELHTSRAAHVYALLNVAQADALIAAWDAKYAYWSMRPQTAIRRWIDDEWTPLLETPPFPGYVSGHSTTGGAAAVALARVFPDEDWRLEELAEENAVSREYGGVHFAADDDAGLELGRRVGRAVVERADAEDLPLGPTRGGS